MATNDMIHNADNGRWTHGESVADGVTSEPVLMPSVQNRYRADDPISMACIPAAGSGRIEFTLDSQAAVIADTAIWLPWTEGNVDGDVVIATSSTAQSGVAALRCVSVVGEVVWRVLK